MTHRLTQPHQEQSCAGLEGGKFKGLGWIGNLVLQGYRPPAVPVQQWQEGRQEP